MKENRFITSPTSVGPMTRIEGRMMNTTTTSTPSQIHPESVSVSIRTPFPGRRELVCTAVVPSSGGCSFRARPGREPVSPQSPLALMGYHREPGAQPHCRQRLPRGLLCRGPPEVTHALYR